MNDLSKTYDPAETEKRWYAVWMARGYFHAVPDPARRPYVIMMPLPNVTGELHMGHALNNGLQDCLIRWNRMRGLNAMWQPGTDHASIAVHVVMERRLAQQGLTRFDLGRDRFLEETWKWKEQIGSTILGQMQRLGFSCDWPRATFTMDPGYYAAVQECFIRLYRKGVIYKGKRMINWCVKDQTSISDLEVEHEEEQSTLYSLRYKGEDGGPGVVIATQRPETILADVAVAVHPDDGRYRALVGRCVIVPVVNRAVPVIADPRVDRGFGTGALKITPGHDPLDNEIGADHGLPVLVCLDPHGRINDVGGTPYQGLDRFECRRRIVDDLRRAGVLEREEAYTTSIGRCARCRTVIEPYISDQWFCRMKDLAAPAIRAVREGRVRFHPERWTRVYMDWMEGIRDWNISRQLWWGHRIPIWYCECGEMIASVERPERCPKCGGGDVTQDPDILDTWFSSALWPMATLGWPRETEDLTYFYPTSTLVTARDIIFLWVARMIMFGLEFRGEVPFRDVYINPTVLNIEGRRMSKSLGTGIDPLELVDRYGADSLRFALINRCTGEQDLRFGEKMVEDTRNFATKIWNAARFVRLVIGDRIFPSAPPSAENLGFADRWILSRLARTGGVVTDAFESFEFREACQALYSFVWSEFCDWYLEMAKKDLARHGPARIGPMSRPSTPHVLAWVLSETMKLLHPVMPFLTEEIWQSLPHGGDTIMQAPWPVPSDGKDRALWSAKWIDSEVESEMETVMGVVRAVRGMRASIGMAREPVAVNLYVPLGRVQSLLQNTKTYIAGLMDVDYLHLGIKEKSPTRVGGIVMPWNSVDVEIYVDSDEARRTIGKRLRKDLAVVEKDLQLLKGRLENSEFLSKARPEVVAADRDRARDLGERRETLARYLAGLGE